MEPLDPKFKDQWYLVSRRDTSLYRSICVCLWDVIQHCSTLLEFFICLKSIQVIKFEVVTFPWSQKTSLYESSILPLCEMLLGELFAEQKTQV